MLISRFPCLFGKYILLDRVNAGGMAEVFRAKVTGAERFERLVAIKCMLPQLMADEHFISMFIDEAKLAAQLTHANIVQIYELGRLGERLYIAMELIAGRDLRHIIRSAKQAQIPIPQGFAAYVLSKAAAGLDFAHRKLAVDGTPLNLVHRDVSPQNILVSYDGEVKVVDFGIAKAEARSTETQAGVLKGKFAYMAPEQVMGDQIDRRADIFALGSVLFETLTGQRLFTGDSDMALLENVRSARLPNLQQSLPPGSAEMQQILERTLTRRPKDRYSYASEFADELERLLIEDRAIFGSKRASQFMQTLFKAEIADLADKIRSYVQVTAESCVESIDGGLQTVPAEPASKALPSGDDHSNWAEVQPMQPDLSEDASLVEPAGGGAVHANIDVSEVARDSGDTPRSDAYVYREQQAIGEASAPDSRPAPRPTARVARRGQAPRSLQATLQEAEGHTPSTDRRGSKQQAQSRITATRLVGETSEQDNPMLHRSGKVLRRLTFAATLAVGVLAVLVTVIFFEARQTGQPVALPEPLTAAFEAMVQRLPESMQPAVVRPTASGPAAPGTASVGAAASGAPVDSGHLTGATGWLQIRSQPGLRGRVLIDNKEVGILPLTPRQLSLGRHEIRLVPGSGRGRSRLLIVEITAQHTRRAPRQAGF